MSRYGVLLIPLVAWALAGPVLGETPAAGQAQHIGAGSPARCGLPAVQVPRAGGPSSGPALVGDYDGDLCPKWPPIPWPPGPRFRSEGAWQHPASLKGFNPQPEPPRRGAVQAEMLR